MKIEAVTLFFNLGLPFVLAGICLVDHAPTFYNSTEFACKEGKLISKNQKISTITTTTPSASTKADSNRQKLKGRRDSEKHCKMDRGKRRRGYQCCGYEQYHPDFETCCEVMRFKSKVHPGMEDKKHVCCELKAYQRSRDVPCRSPARNDPFTRPSELSMNDKRLRRNCFKFEHAFLIYVKGKTESGYKTTITRIKGISTNTSARETRKMPLPTDHYFPTRNLKRQAFLVLSNDDLMYYLYLDIYLEKDDEVFTVSGGRKKEMKRLIRRWKKICKTRSRKNSKKGKASRKRKNGNNLF